MNENSLIETTNLLRTSRKNKECIILIRSRRFGGPVNHFSTAVTIALREVTSLLEGCCGGILTREVSLFHGLTIE